MHALLGRCLMKNNREIWSAARDGATVFANVPIPVACTVAGGALIYDIKCNDRVSR